MLKTRFYNLVLQMFSYNYTLICELPTNVHPLFSFGCLVAPGVRNLQVHQQTHDSRKIVRRPLKLGYFTKKREYTNKCGYKSKQSSSYSAGILSVK